MVYRQFGGPKWGFGSEAARVRAFSGAPTASTLPAMRIVGTIRRLGLDSVRSWGLALGPLAFVVLLAMPTPEDLSVVGQRVLAITAWTALWWVTEAIPINATAFLPFLLFPVLGVLGAREAAIASTSDTLYLFLCGFFLAAALERWGLHRRLALGALRILGTSPRRLLLGVMVMVAFLSMWLTNTATTVMMVPILLAVVSQAESTLTREQARGFAAALLLGTALAANIGGMGTPVGTVPNAVAVGQLAERGIEVSFIGWMGHALPIVAVLIPVAWFVLVIWATKLPRDMAIGDSAAIEEQARALGAWTSAEKRVGFVFLLAVVLWLTRQDIDLGDGVGVPGWAGGLEWAGLIPDGAGRGIRDGTVAALAGLLLFIIPASRGGPRLLDWEHAQKVPWGVLFLLGGGFLLAKGFTLSGDDGSSLGVWTGERLRAFQDLPLLGQLLLVAIFVSMLTEFASNTATCTLILPILFGVAVAGGQPLQPFGFAAALAASCSFMMPVATPPNALVFGTGRVPIGLMIRNGIGLNVLGAIVIGTITWLLR